MHITYGGVKWDVKKEGNRINSLNVATLQDCYYTIGPNKEWRTFLRVCNVTRMVDTKIAAAIVKRTRGVKWNLVHRLYNKMKNGNPVVPPCLYVEHLRTRVAGLSKNITKDDFKKLDVPKSLLLLSTQQYLLWMIKTRHATVDMKEAGMHSLKAAESVLKQLNTAAAKFGS